MKHLKLIVVIFTLLLTLPANAEDYIVKASALNVRSCASTNCEIVGKLTKGELVASVQDNNGWVKIITDSGNGYVIKSALSEASYHQDSLYHHDFSFSIFIHIIFLILATIVIIHIYLLPSKIAADNKNADKIYRVNLFLGWIPFVWLILLLAALIGESRES